MAESLTVRLGTRASPLARWQAEWVTAQLTQRGVTVELVVITTTGDVRPEPIGQLATQGVFTKQIQRALLDHEIDLAVHSLKDLPTEVIPELRLAAVPTRAAVGDALICRAAPSFAALPAAATVATGSLRRRAQLLAARPDLQLVDVRGNIDTRIGKLRAGQFDALVLAEAGLHRLALNAQIVEVFDKTLMLPAVGQGALGLEVRVDDKPTTEAVATLNDPASHQAVIAERTLLAGLRGGCLAPVGAWGRIEGDELVLEAIVLSVDGQQKVTARLTGPPSEAAAIGHEAAERLIAAGATQLIQDARR